LSESRSHPLASVRARRESVGGIAREWGRLSAFFVALGILILVPFALWGSQLDRAAPAWLGSFDAQPWMVLLGISLLVADVVAPVPSSLVCMALCWSLGPLWGGVTVALGTSLAFATGYGLGRMVPEPRLRAWVGAELWDRARARARRHSLWWIAASRPLPVLAEVTALLAGTWRVPAATAFAHAALASTAMGAIYGATASLGRAQPNALLALAVLLALPAASWLLHRVALRRARARRPNSVRASTQSHDEEVS
jgi:uncharacterized membrane protein YdjX (TVP38/TMEM64 family)